MKIGIISINAHTKVLNFASPLHSYAFWSFLKDHGIDSEIIDYKPVYYGKFDPRHPLFYYIDHPKADEKDQQRTLKKWKNLFFEREKRYDRIQEFIDTYYVTTPECYTAKVMDKKDPGYDCYICATDVIWKWNPHNGFDKGFLLACRCMRGKHKIAYAASRGATTFTSEQEAQFKSYLNDFDFISVREKSLQEYCTPLTEKPVAHVLDPVFLKDADFYADLAIEPKETGYVLIYIVMEKAKSLVATAVNFARKHNLKVIELSEDLEDRTIPDGQEHDVIYGLGVEEWLGYMKNADYIFTNSFHACCFSIIFQKEFWAGKRSGDKINSVLEIMGLAGRRVDASCENGDFPYDPIDWDSVDKIRASYYETSKEFILNAIHTCEADPKPPVDLSENGPEELPEQKVSDTKAQVQPTEAKKEAGIWQKLKGIMQKK